MNPKCRAQLNAARVAAGGKPLTDAQANAIHARLSATMRRMARRDPQAWAALPLDQRMLQAAQQAAADIAAEAARKVANAQRQALKTAETEVRIQEQRARAGEGRGAALVHDIERTAGYIEGVKRDNLRRLTDLIEASSSTEGTSLGRRALMFLFDADNPQMSRDLAMEVYARGQAGTGNALARKGAEAWLNVIEAMRQRFNAAGGDVGQLDYGYVPLPDSSLQIRKAGRDRWVADVLPGVDRSRYVKEDGARMSDAEVMEVLGRIWETKASDGLNKTPPGQFKGAGARANHGSQHRELHFKDGDAYLGYLSKYGEGGMYGAMVAHLGGMARDIGLVERYGPNPEAQMRLQLDVAERADGEVKRVFGNRPDAYWRLVNGTAGTAQSANVAAVGSHVRNVETFAKLQGAVLSSVTDLGTYFVTAGFNKLGYWEALRNIGRQARGDTREFLTAHGAIADSLINDLDRWAGDHIGRNWSGKLASATMRLSFMNAWTDSLRRAFSMTMMGGMAKLSRTDWGSLADFDRWRMENAGLTAADWSVIQQAQLVAHRGTEFLTPDAIYGTGDPRAREVAAKYLGLVTDEANTAVIEPDLATRAITTGGGLQRGTIPGELARATAQFKSFPIAMISRHWRRMLETPQGLEGAPLPANRLAYAGAMLVSLTALGAIAFQTKQMVGGKDPVDMTTPKFWGRALAQGGGLGFFGDMLLTDTTEDRSPLETMGSMLMGPSFTSAAELYSLTKGNVDEWRAGKDTHAGAEGLRFARGHLPLVNLWYARAAIDHAGLQSIQENLSPGYLSRIKNKARKDWHQEYWWQPGEGLPERAPDLSAVAGD